MLFRVIYNNDIYGVFATTNRGDDDDKFLIYSHKERAFKWVYVVECRLTN